MNQCLLQGEVCQKWKVFPENLTTLREHFGSDAAAEDLPR